MDDQQLLRYSRQIMLPEIDVNGQQRLIAATVLIIGAGGLGSAASIYLAAGGVGHIVLVDFDRVELANLQRQILYNTADVGRMKTAAAGERLAALNPETRITLIDRALDDTALRQRAAEADVIVDASDNFSARFAINRAAVATRTPLVSGAAIRFEAQLSVFNPGDAASPCYRCLYREDTAVEETCAANGALAPLLGIIGSIQAAEAMKLIMGLGESLQGRLLLLDALTMEWSTARLPKDPGCPVCGGP